MKHNISQKASDHLEPVKMEKSGPEEIQDVLLSNEQLTYKTNNGNKVKVNFSEEVRKRFLKGCPQQVTP